MIRNQREPNKNICFLVIFVKITLAPISMSAVPAVCICAARYHQIQRKKNTNLQHISTDNIYFLLLFISKHSRTLASADCFVVTNVMSLLFIIISLAAEQFGHSPNQIENARAPDTQTQKKKKTANQMRNATERYAGMGQDGWRTHTRNDTSKTTTDENE